MQLMAVKTSPKTRRKRSTPRLLTQSMEVSLKRSPMISNKKQPLRLLTKKTPLMTELRIILCLWAQIIGLWWFILRHRWQILWTSICRRTFTRIWAGGKSDSGVILCRLVAPCPHPHCKHLTFTHQTNCNSLTKKRPHNKTQRSKVSFISNSLIDS